MARKGQFKKGGGRVGGGGSSKKRRAPAVKALVIAAPRAPARRHHYATAVAARPKKGSGRRRHAHQPPSLVKIAATALTLANVAEKNDGILGDKIYNLVQKIPGAKTFGGAATAGIALGALGKYTNIGGPRVKPWLKAAGVVGVVAAFLKAGTMGQNFKWLGDSDMDVAGDDDMDVEG